MIPIDEMRETKRYKVKHEVLGRVASLVVFAEDDTRIADFIMDPRDEIAHQRRIADVVENVDRYSEMLVEALRAQSEPEYEIVRCTVNAMDELVRRYLVFMKTFVWEEGL